MSNFWTHFKSDRRGLISLRLLTIIVLACLFSDFIANDRPLFIFRQGQLFFPIIHDYTDTELGGQFASTVDFSDATTRQRLNVEGFALYPLIEWRYDTIDMALDEPAPAGPSWQHLFGTDDLGRDVLSNLLYGLRLSLIFGVILTIASSLIGVILGAVQGYMGGMVDLIGQRLIEIWSGLPSLYILMILASLIEPGFVTLLVIMTLFSWTHLVGLVRAEFLRARQADYVKAAKILGLSDLRIMSRHILPNAIISALTYMPFLICGAITTLTSLDFLGLGLPIGSPSLGALLQKSKANLDAPWLGISCFVTLSLFLSLLVFVGDAVRGALDPKRRGRHVGHS